MSLLSGQFIVACWVFFLICMLFAAFSSKRTVQRTSTWRTVSLVVAVMSVIVICGSNLLPYVDIGLWPRTLGGALIGDVVTLAGMMVVLWARATIGRNWSPAVVIMEDHELIAGGPYRYVRHPMYSGLLLMSLGGLIYLGNLAGFVVFLCVLTGLAVKAHLEERLLTSHFPQAYPAYKTRVKALVPFVW